MPFTLSHCAAALPFRRSRLPLSALLVGCMAPDFEYVVQLSDYNRAGHTLRGALLLTLPASLLFLWVFHSFLRRPLSALLPRPLEQRVAALPEDFSFQGATRVGLVILALATGIATHLAWDEITHGDTWLALHYAIFHRWLPLPGGHSAPVYYLLQGISTAAGLLVVALWFFAWARRTAAAPLDAHFRVLPEWLKLTVFTVIAATALAVAYYLTLREFGPAVRTVLPGLFLGNVAVKSLALFSWQMLLYAAAWTVFARKPRARVLAS